MQGCKSNRPAKKTHYRISYDANQKTLENRVRMDWNFNIY